VLERVVTERAKLERLAHGAVNVSEGERDLDVLALAGLVQARLNLLRNVAVRFLGGSPLATIRFRSSQNDVFRTPALGPFPRSQIFENSLLKYALR
jgi:hypothetical protein